MERKVKLLPHWCQITGYAYILGFIVCFIYARIYMTGILPDWGIVNGLNGFIRSALAHWNLVGTLNFIMIFLAIFSKEKVEDERTLSIRINALLYLVFFIFALYLLLYIPAEGRLMNSLRSIKGWLQDFGVMALTYAILYKIMIWTSNWRMRDEE